MIKKMEKVEVPEEEEEAEVEAVEVQEDLIEIIKDLVMAEEKELKVMIKDQLLKK